MFSKTFFAFALVFAMVLQASAHTGIYPALGVDQFERKNVHRQSDGGGPCGMNIAKNLDSSKPIEVDDDGTFTATVESYNGGVDGTRLVNLQVDASGTGDNFVDGKVTKNGARRPSTKGVETITAQLPPGTQCKGGKNGDLCLGSFVQNTGKFGNCVVLQQKGQAKGKAADNAEDNAKDNAKDEAEDEEDNANDEAKGNAKNKTKGDKRNAKRDPRAVGSRAARAYLHANRSNAE